MPFEKQQETIEILQQAVDKYQTTRQWEVAISMLHIFVKMYIIYIHIYYIYIARSKVSKRFVR